MIYLRRRVGLGETNEELVLAFRTKNRLARAYHAQGNYLLAAETFEEAESLWRQIENREIYREDLEFTRAILAGDTSATSDYQAQQARMAVVVVNARPEDPNAVFMRTLGQELDPRGTTNVFGQWFADVKRYATLAALGALALGAGALYLYGRAQRR